jgi:hypothetical protein
VTDIHGVMSGMRSSTIPENATNISGHTNTSVSSVLDNAMMHQPATTVPTSLTNVSIDPESDSILVEPCKIVEHELIDVPDAHTKIMLGDCMAQLFNQQLTKTDITIGGFNQTSQSSTVGKYVQALHKYRCNMSDAMKLEIGMPMFMAETQTDTVQHLHEDVLSVTSTPYRKCVFLGIVRSVVNKRMSSRRYSIVEVVVDGPAITLARSIVPDFNTGGRNEVAHITDDQKPGELVSSINPRTKESCLLGRMIVPSGCSHHVVRDKNTQIFAGRVVRLHTANNKHTKTFAGKAVIHVNLALALREELAGIVPRI